MANSMPFWNGIIMAGSGTLPFVTASIRAWISSLRAKLAFPFLPPTLSSKLRPVELFCIARGPVGRSVLRAFEGPWLVGDGERAEAVRFWDEGEVEVMADAIAC